MKTPDLKDRVLNTLSDSDPMTLRELAAVVGVNLDDEPQKIALLAVLGSHDVVPLRCYVRRRAGGAQGR